VKQFQYDESLFPLVVVTAPATVELAALNELFASFQRSFERKSRYALLLDLSNVSEIPDAGLRRKISEWEGAHVADTRRWNVCSALVIRSALVRGAFTALRWLVADQAPRQHFGSRQEAIDFCISGLEREGIAMPPALVALRGRHDRESIAP
jgi:hypothetical protein